MILTLLSTLFLKAWLNNENTTRWGANLPAPTHTTGVASFPQLFLSFFQTSSISLLQRQMILIQHKPHRSRLTWGPFLWFLCIRKAKEFLPFLFSFGAQEEGFWLKRTHCVSFVTNDILHEKGSTCLSSKWKKNDTGVSNIRLVFSYCG